MLSIKFHAKPTEVCGSRLNIADVNKTITSDPQKRKKLSVMFDSIITVSALEASVLKSANGHLVNIGRARRLLIEKTTEFPFH